MESQRPDGCGQISQAPSGTEPGSLDVSPGFLERYTIDRLLGQGGMGVVYAGTQKSLGRRVAIKFMLQADPEAVERFTREARSLARLSHPNVVSVHDAGVESGRPYLVCELVEGTTLEDRIARQGSIPGPDAARLGQQIADGLVHAHEAGIVHRDLKSANVLLDSRGHAKICDFGIARAEDDVRRLTQTGCLIGTPEFMAPEVITGEPSRPASDLYALGCILHHMVTGSVPFPVGQAGARTVLDVLDAHVRLPVPDSPALAACPRVLQEVITSCLEKDPTRRPASAAAVSKALAPMTAPAPATASVTAGPGPRPPVRTMALSARTAPRKGGSSSGTVEVTLRTRTPRGARHAAVAGVAVALLSVVLAITLRTSPPRPGPASPGQAVPLSIVDAQARLAGDAGQRPTRDQLLAFGQAAARTVLEKFLGEAPPDRATFASLVRAERARHLAQASWLLAVGGEGARVACDRAVVWLAGPAFEPDGAIVDPGPEILERIGAYAMRGSSWPEFAAALERHAATPHAWAPFRSKAVRACLEAEALWRGGDRAGAIARLRSEVHAHPGIVEPLALLLRMNPGEPLPRRQHWVCETDGAPMVFVPAGEFTMGSLDVDPDARDDEKPARRVRLSAFFIDKYPVTIRRYATFENWMRQHRDHAACYRHSPCHAARSFYHLRRGPDGQRAGEATMDLVLAGQKPTLPAAPPDPGTSPRSAPLPATGMTWYDAFSYAGWAGKRLPTESQWEKAARGTDARIYPWGNERATKRHANIADFDMEKNPFTPVHAFEHVQSPYGTKDQAGNVWEWCLDWYLPEALIQLPDGALDPQGPGSGSARVQKGGCRYRTADRCRAAGRDRESPGRYHEPGWGFRTALPLPPLGAPR